MGFRAGAQRSTSARVTTAEGRLTDEAGELFAHATTACMVFRSKEGPVEGEPGG